MILSRALTSIATVTFPVSSADRDVLDKARRSGSTVRPLGASDLSGRIGALFGHGPATITLLSTRDPETTATLFEELGFPWHLQGQIAVLSPLDSGAPAIDRETLLSLIDNGWDDNRGRLFSAGVVGSYVQGWLAISLASSH